MTIMKVATALTLSVAFVAALAATPQTTKPAAPARTTDQKPAKPPAPKAMSEAVKPADLPKAVTDAVMKDHPKATITSATKMTKGPDVTYSVKVKDGTKTSTMKFTADGKMVMPKGK